MNNELIYETSKKIRVEQCHVRVTPNRVREIRIQDYEVQYFQEKNVPVFFKIVEYPDGHAFSYYYIHVSLEDLLKIAK